MAETPVTAVVHELAFPQRQNQYVHVTSIWPVAGDSLELSMPSWTPGSYLIRDFAGNVERLQALGPDGAPREVRKTDKNHWLIDTAGTARVTVSYDVWAGELNVATSWVEAGGALLNGAGVFLYSEQSRSEPQRVTIDLPPDWPGVYTPLPAAGPSRTYQARDYDELVDSPIAAGEFHRHEFRVGAQDYALLFQGGNVLWDEERARDDVAKIVEAQQAFWGVNPFEREFLFLNFFMGPFGGLEHDHAAVMMCDPWQMTGREDYVEWLGLVSHEFFHAWNVRRMRPSALAKYDYNREMYTRELWLAEGLSSYYDDLLLFRSGLLDVSDYFDLLAQEVRNYEIMPGREVRSVEHASFDTWIKQYQPDENTINSTVSYYRKGALVGFVTDTAIRRETRNRASLDDVMREMYARYGPAGPGRGAYPPGAFESVVEQIAGAGVRRYVEGLLQGTGDPDVDAALDWYGLSLDRGPGSAPGKTGQRELPTGFGVVWDTSGGRLLVGQVILGRAGARAGMLPGDELLAVDGYRVTAADYSERLKRLRAGQVVEVTVVRHQRLLTLHAEAQPEIPDRYFVVNRERLGRAEQQRLEAWLGRELLFRK